MNMWGEKPKITETEDLIFENRKVESHKDAKGIPVMATRTYVRASDKAERAYEERMRAMGLEKRRIEFSPGKFGYTWERFRPATEDELRVAKAGCIPASNTPPGEIPPKESWAKPTAVDSSGKPLDETADWPRIFDNLDDLGGKKAPRTSKRKGKPVEVIDVSLNEQDSEPQHEWPEVDLTAYEGVIVEPAES